MFFFLIYMSHSVTFSRDLKFFMTVLSSGRIIQNNSIQFWFLVNNEVQGFVYCSTNCLIFDKNECILLSAG